MHKPTLVFDLDGTLVDTAPDLVAATNHALADLGLAPVPDAALRASIGRGARYMIVEALRQTGLTLPEPDIDRLLELFLAYYEANIANTSRPFDGAMDVLAELRGAGYPLVVCTNKREDLSRLLLDALGMTGLFAALAGRDTFTVFKPHPDHLRKVVLLAGGNPARAIMIGDTSIDVATARAACVPAIACSFGYPDMPPESLAADRTIGHFGELAAAVAVLAPVLG
jgi:phosphoglycolate phosphatase